MALLDATGRTGQTIPVEIMGLERQAYLPPELPFDPPLRFDAAMQRLLQEAYYTMGRLDGSAGVLPNRELLYYMYLRKEAVLSSQIEGTESSLNDFFSLEARPDHATDDLDYLECLNYTRAFEHALEHSSDGAISLARLCEVHGLLLATGRGSDKGPGKLRTAQNWIGGRSGVRYVPPPPDRIAALTENLLWYINEGPAPAGVLGKAAVAHAQFETIHPFLDGNGRLGRMLITWMLCRSGKLRWPVLLLSLHLKRHRREYFDALSDIREHGDWESWTSFFLTGVIHTANAAGESALAIAELVRADRERLHEARASYYKAIKLHEHLLRRPYTTVNLIVAETELKRDSATSVLEALCELGLCSETTGRRRNRLYRYNAYMDLLNEGTET